MTDSGGGRFTPNSKKKSLKFQNVYFHCIFSLEVACVGPARVKGIAEFDYHVLPSDLMSFWKFDHMHYEFIVVSYCISQPINLGQWLLISISVGGFICQGGAYMQIKKCNWEDRHHKTEWKSLLENIKKVYCIICCFIHQKNRNQGIYTGWLMHGGAYKYEGAYTWSKTSVKENEGLSAGGEREIQYAVQSHSNKYNFQIQWIILQL